MEQQWSNAFASIDSPRTYYSGADDKISMGSPKNQRMFARKPAIDYCKKIRQAKSRLDCSSEFAGFYSPKHTTSAANDVPRQQDVQLFRLHSPKVAKDEPLREEKLQTSDRKTHRQPMRQLTTTPFEMTEDTKNIPVESRQVGLKRSLKQNVHSHHELSNMRKQLTILQKEVCILKLQNSTLKEHNSYVLNQTQGFKEQIKELERQLRESARSLADASRRSLELMRQRDSSWLQLNNLKDELLDSQKTIKNLREARQSLQNEMQQKDFMFIELERQKSEAQAQLECLNHSTAIERDMHLNYIKYADIELWTLKKRRYESDQLLKSQVQNKKLAIANKKLRVLIIQLKEKLNSVERIPPQDQIFELSPERK